MIGTQSAPGWLALAPGSRRLVVLARLGPRRDHEERQRQLTSVLRSHGQSTLRFDPPHDGAPAPPAGPIDGLASCLAQALEWAAQAPRLAGMSVGLFGAGVGAAAALRAAAAHPSRVAAVVSCGGRPHLAGSDLERVQAPTLLIVGGEDLGGLAQGRQALLRLPGRRRLEVVPGATRNFDEPGALVGVASLAAQWFDAHLDGRRNGLMST